MMTAQTVTIDLPAARNKLLQAELLLAHLRNVPVQIARDIGRAVDRDRRLPLETFFFACLNAAQSVLYILRETGRRQFKSVESSWRASLTEAERARFNKMMGLRGRDVHWGDVDTMALPKMIEADEFGDTTAYVQHNAALFGPAPVAEHVNPDGIKVSARSLRGSVGLYIEIDGLKCEATNACAHFIGQIRSLMAAAEGWAPAAQSEASGHGVLP